MPDSFLRNFPTQRTRLPVPDQVIGSGTAPPSDTRAGRSLGGGLFGGINRVLTDLPTNPVA